MKLKTTKTKVTRFLQTFVVTPLFLLPLFLFFVLQLSHLTASLWISFLILNMQMIWEVKRRRAGGVGSLLRLDSLPPPAPPLRLLLLLFPGWSRSGLVSRSTLRNDGHGVSLGKQRPGQQGFTQTLIILRAISGESPQLYT